MRVAPDHTSQAPSRVEAPARAQLLTPDDPFWSQRAPDAFRIRLETTQGVVVIDGERAWAPRGADRFYNLVRAGYYDGAKFFRVVAGSWAQFGINGEPRIASLWRTRRIPDDPRVRSNVRGAVAFAMSGPDDRTTQVYINLADNAARLDPQGFAPFGIVVAGMDHVDALYSGYGESSGGGIRAGKQDPLFSGGAAYIEQQYPRLDAIVRASAASR